MVGKKDKIDNEADKNNDKNRWRRSYRFFQVAALGRGDGQLLLVMRGLPNVLVQMLMRESS